MYTTPLLHSLSATPIASTLPHTAISVYIYLFLRNFLFHITFYLFSTHHLSNIFIYCFRFIFATVKSILNTLHSSIIFMYIPPSIPLYMSQYKNHCSSLVHHTVSKSQTLVSNLSNAKWIIIFKDYMNKKMILAPTSMCRITLTLSPYFTGIFI